MASRLDNLKALNTGRWKAQGHHQGDDDARDHDQLLAAAPVVATGGALFNLPNPTNNGEFVKPYVRDRDAQAERFRGELVWIDPKTYERTPTPANGGNDWMRTRAAVPSSGDDFTSVPLGSVYKYRVPPTSVTRKQGDCRLFGCCGWRWTAVSYDTRTHFLLDTHSTNTLLTHRPNGFGCSTSCASLCTRAWSLSRSGWRTGGTTATPSGTPTTS